MWEYFRRSSFHPLPQRAARQMSSEQFYPSYRTCNNVTAQCPVEATTYGYYPDLPVNAFFAAAFGLLLITSLVIGIRRKTWSYTAFLGVGALLEFLGYIGRILMHTNPWNSGAFQVGIFSYSQRASDNDESRCRFVVSFLHLASSQDLSI